MPFPIAVRAIFLHAIVHSTMLVALVALASLQVARRVRKKEAPPRGGALLRMPFAIALWQIAGDGASEVDRRHGSGAARLHPHEKLVGGFVGDLAAATRQMTPRLLTASIPSRGHARRRNGPVEENRVSFTRARCFES